MKRSNENSQSAQLTQQIKVVNTVLEDVSSWSGERNISISINTSVPFQNYPKLPLFQKKKKKLLLLLLLF
jgi:hypothetical protein